MLSKSLCADACQVSDHFLQILATGEVQDFMMQNYLSETNNCSTRK